jgi:gliding motility-associated-like protein
VTASASLTITDPQPLVLLGDDVLAECTDSLVLVVAASGGTGTIALLWADGTAGTTVWVPGDVDGTYPVTATDACGQTATLALDVEVDCEILIPNVFSPNGDGQNDRFEIEGIQSRQNTVRVFNRWGQVVFEANNYRNTWDGRNVPDGTYFYEVVVEGGEGPFTGHLTILNN